MANVAPTATLTATPDALPAGSPAGAVTLTLVGLANPADPVAGLRSDYDFDNNGTIDFANVPATQPVSVPAAYLASAGLHTIRAALRDADGGVRDFFVTLTVTDVPIAFALAQVGPASEGGTLSLRAAVASAGSRPVTSWRIEWGDGSVHTVAADGTGTQTFAHAHADADRGRGGTRRVRPARRGRRPRHRHGPELHRRVGRRHQRDRPRRRSPTDAHLRR